MMSLQKADGIFALSLDEGSITSRRHKCLRVGEYQRLNGSNGMQRIRLDECMRVSLCSVSTIGFGICIFVSLRYSVCDRLCTVLAENGIVRILRMRMVVGEIERRIHFNIDICMLLCGILLFAIEILITVSVLHMRRIIMVALWLLLDVISCTCL